MKERGKAIDDHTENVFVDVPCKKHPYSSSSSVGICAECLKERLVKLVCSECGEQRLSSCSCSDFSSYLPDHDSSSVTADVASVGRISFLIENERPRKDDKSNRVILLRRSASSCVEVKKDKGLWKMKRFFNKIKEGIKVGYEKDAILDDKTEVWVSDIVGVSRSRSLCSFRGNNGLNDTDEGSDCRFSSAKVSDATAGGGILSDYDKHCGFESRKSGVRGGVYDESEPRKSGFSKGVLLDHTSEPRNSGYSGVSCESEPRKSGFRGLLLSDEHEPRKSGFSKGVILDHNTSEPRNSGFSVVSYDSDPRKSGGYRSLLDESEARKSGFRGLFDDQEASRRSGFSGVSYESEPRKNGFRLVSSDAEKEKNFNNNIKKTGSSKTQSVPGFSISALDDSAFIDLNLDSSSSSFKAEIPLPLPHVRIGRDLEINSARHRGSSCGMRVNEKGRRSSSSSYNKVWKWLSKQYTSSKSSRKKCEDGKNT